MWNVLTTASATPILEIDFLGADAWELLGFPDQAKFSGLQSGELHTHTHAPDSAAIWLPAELISGWRGKHCASGHDAEPTCRCKDSLNAFLLAIDWQGLLTVDFTREQYLPRIGPYSTPAERNDLKPPISWEIWASRVAKETLLMAFSEHWLRVCYLPY